jgi:hypothetical protein
LFVIAGERFAPNGNPVVSVERTVPRLAWIVESAASMVGSKPLTPAPRTL